MSGDADLLDIGSKRKRMKSGYSGLCSLSLALVKTGDFPNRTNRRIPFSGEIPGTISGDSASPFGGISPSLKTMLGTVVKLYGLLVSENSHVF